MRSPKIETGTSFGRLTVVSFQESSSGRGLYECRCSCGKTTSVQGYNLEKGRVSSCGCLKLESMRTRRITHGASYSKAYYAYAGMKDRCYRESHHAYAAYGGRGIRVCDRWLNGDGSRSGFECFMADMGPKPTSDHTLDRHPDNDGPYSPDNCRWATKKEQANNRRPARQPDAEMEHI